MNLSRRSILQGIFAAPAVISIDNLMPIKLWVPTIYGDAIHDDWEGLTALINGEDVDIRSKTIYVIDRFLGFTSVNNKYSLSRPLFLADAPSYRRDAFIGDSFIAHPGFEGEALLMGNRDCSFIHDERINPPKSYPSTGGSMLINCFLKNTFF